MNERLIKIGLAGIAGLFAGTTMGYRNKWINSELKNKDLTQTLDRTVDNLGRAIKVTQDQNKIIDELKCENQRLRSLKRIK